MTRPKAPKSKSRGGSATPTAAQAVAAAAAAAGGGAQQQQGQAAAKKRPTAGATGADEGPEVDQLEEKRKQVAEELRNVEKQVCRWEGRTKKGGRSPKPQAGWRRPASPPPRHRLHPTPVAAGM